MKSTLLFTLVCGVLLLATSAEALADGGLLPNLNPFSSQRQKKAPVSSRGGAPTSGWQWPRLWPTSSSSPQRKSSSPSTWQKMNAGTKNFLSQTADTLNPFNDAEDNKPQPGMTGSNSIFSQASQSRKKNEEKSGFSLIPSWWGGQEEEQKDSTVNEFLMRKRPGFE
ncbi:MAG TPA: hypothetical protein VFV87_14995 [Pirellulaceae bacterium]|nr:hypothetical protein [Pirellulaceae bacterium]